MKRLIVFILVLMMCLPMAVHGESATASLHEIYTQAELLMAQGNYDQAAVRFEALGAYLDASQLTMYCKAISAAENHGLHLTAVDAFEALGDFKDSKQMARYYKARAYQDAGAINVRSANNSAFDKAIWHNQEALKIYNEMALFKDSMIRSSACSEKISEIKGEQSRRTQAAREATYQKALGLEQNGDYTGAIKLYQTIKGYADSNARIVTCQEAYNEQIYQNALSLEQQGEYAQAINLYRKIPTYLDSKNRINEIKYQTAMKAYEEGRWQDAIDQFTALGNYSDAVQWVETSRASKKREENMTVYANAEKLEAEGNYIAAYEAFYSLRNFEDSAPRAARLAVYVTLEEAEQLAQSGKYENVKALLKPYKEHPAAQALYKTATLRSANLVTAFNTEGWAIAQEKNWYYYFLNIEGNTKDLNAVYQYSGWHDGLMLVKSKEDFGYLNMKGDIAFEQTFRKAEAFHQGKALVTKKDGTVCVIDTAGEVAGVMPEKAGRTYKEYAGEDLVIFKEKDKYGLINLEGKVVVKAKYTKFIKKFEFGLAVTCTYRGKNYAYSIINPKGKAVINEGKYEIMDVLSENLVACYLRNDTWGKGKTYPGVINLKGKTIMKGEYNNQRFHRMGDLIMLKANSSAGTYWAVYDKEANYLMGYVSSIQPLVSGDGKHIYVENWKGGVKQISLLYDPDQWRRDLNGCQMAPDSPYIALKKNDGWHVYDLELNLIN